MHVVQDQRPKTVNSDLKRAEKSRHYNSMDAREVAEEWWSQIQEQKNVTVDMPDA